MAYRRNPLDGAPHAGGSTMSQLRLLALALLVPLATATAQTPAPAGPPIRVATTSVSRVTLTRINPGQNAAYNRDMVDNLIPIYEAAKAAGILVGYTLFNKSTLDDPEDWQRGITLTYANWAAIDGLAAKMDPITLRHYGTAEKRAAANAARLTIATTVSAFYSTNQSYTR
jgi:hypothetical protein